MKQRVTAVFLSGLLLGCTENDLVPPNHPPIAEMQITEDATQFTLDASLSADKDGNALSYSWSSSSDKISIDSPTSENTFFNIPTVVQSFTVDVTLQVSDGKLTNTTTQTVLIPYPNQIQAYGLGTQLTASVSNNTNYDWYIDQATSGTYASVNCGPTSVTMAIKWASKDFSKTPPSATGSVFFAGVKWSL